MVMAYNVLNNRLGGNRQRLLTGGMTAPPNGRVLTPEEYENRGVEYPAGFLPPRTDFDAENRRRIEGMPPVPPGNGLESDFDPGVLRENHPEFLAPLPQSPMGGPMGGGMGVPNHLQRLITYLGSLANKITTAIDAVEVAGGRFDPRSVGRTGGVAGVQQGPMSGPPVENPDPRLVAGGFDPRSVVRRGERQPVQQMRRPMGPMQGPRGLYG